MPNTPWPMPVDQLWYSIDIGPVHFVTINTEVFYSLLDQKNKQLTWLRADLQAVNARRDQSPWVVVLGHRPMYCSLTDTTDKKDLDCADEKTSPVRSALEDLFFEEGVDVYISGHRHNYERSWPMFRGKAFQQGYRNPEGPIHIVNGAMGYEYITEKFTKPYLQWSAFRQDDPSKELYGRLQVLNSSHLMWDVYTAQNNEHEDSILVIQQRHGSFGKAEESVHQVVAQRKDLPPAPFAWNPTAKVPASGAVLGALYALPPDTRRFYLLTMCCTLLTSVICLLAMPRFRRRVCRW
jgi:hypothetical protein